MSEKLNNLFLNLDILESTVLGHIYYKATLTVGRYLHQSQQPPEALLCRLCTTDTANIQWWNKLDKHRTSLQPLILPGPVA